MFSMGVWEDLIHPYNIFVVTLGQKLQYFSNFIIFQLRVPAKFCENLLLWPSWHYFPAIIYLFKVNNRKTRKWYEICSKLTIKTLERRYWRRSGVFIVNFEYISHFFLVFLLLTLKSKFQWFLYELFSCF